MVSKSIIVLLALVGVVAANQRGGAIPGGLTPETQVNDEVRKMVTDLEGVIRSQQTTIEKIEPISFRTQVVAGTNYFIKAKVQHSDNTSNYVHLRVYKSFKNHIELHSMKKDLGENVVLEHFE